MILRSPILLLAAGCATPVLPEIKFPLFICHTGHLDDGTPGIVCIPYEQDKPSLPALPVPRG